MRGTIRTLDKRVKAGADYERFVYEKMQVFFPYADVKLNDKIVGRDSGLKREIDVSIRLIEHGSELLYIVQCKDWVNRVDINTVGTLAAVMQDVGASKGFLLCTAGFHQSNHRYALARGIELITIEDIKSQKWNVSVQIPFVYIRKINMWRLKTRLRQSAELRALNADPGRHVEIDMSHFSAKRPESRSDA